MTRTIDYYFYITTIAIFLIKRVRGFWCLSEVSDLVNVGFHKLQTIGFTIIASPKITKGVKFMGKELKHSFLNDELFKDVFYKDPL